MKMSVQIGFLPILIIVTLCCQYQLFAQQNSGDITVILTDLENNDGHVLVSLVNSKRTFLSDDPYRGEQVEPKNRQAVYTFKDVPFGTYAVSAFHDENDNLDLDTNFLGIPTEEYGFSNNARGTFGPPDYEEAAFRLNTTKLTIKIELD